MAPLADFLAQLPIYLPVHYTSYVRGPTPFSTTPPVVTTLVFYLAVVFGIQAYMRDKPPQKLNALFQVHNIILSAGSLVLLSLILEEILPIMWNQGLFSALCAEESWTPRLEFYYMINYYFKYWELFDTVFLALKKKPLQFLHVYHHSATAFFAYAQLNGRTSMSWLSTTINLAIHVVMYYYYYATARGVRFWWKKYLTTIQIIQFLIGISASCYWMYLYVSHNYSKGTLPSSSTCAGSASATMFGWGLLTSYLVLFVNFYIQTYKVSSKKGGATGNGKTNGSLRKKE